MLLNSALLRLLLTSVLPGVALGQSMNIDLGPAGSSAGVPSSTFGAAAGSAGVWNDVTVQDTPALLGLDGLPTGASLHISSAFMQVSDHPATAGDVAALLDDRCTSGDFFVYYEFSGLEPGEYEVYAYSLHNGSNSGGNDIYVLGNPGFQFCSQTWSGSFQVGGDHNYDQKTVTDGTLTVADGFWFLSDFAYLCGIQLVRAQGAGFSSYCDQAPCPCANPGAAGEGCANSTGAGARLATGGTPSVSADDLSFIGHQLLPGQPALLFSGTTMINSGNGVAFGDGLRCAGGSVLRLGVAIPNGSGRAFWGPGLAAAGGWSAGDVRNFQVWYRDPSGSPCGSNFNLSQGIAASFAP